MQKSRKSFSWVRYQATSNTNHSKIMFRCPRALNFGFFSAALVFGCILNAILLMEKRFHPTKTVEANLRENKDILHFLPMLGYDQHQGLLLGEKSSRVTLAIGMIVTVNALDEPTFTKTARQIIEQDPKPNGWRSLVIILLLFENRKSKIEKILDVLKTDFARSLEQGYIQLVISPVDAEADYFESLYRYNKVRQLTNSSARINLRVSYLMFYGAVAAKSFMIIDNSHKLTKNAMKDIYNQINKMTPRSLNIELTPVLNGRLYNAKFIPRYSAVLYTMAFVGVLDRSLMISSISSVNETTHQYKGRQIFITENRPLNNPKAVISSTMTSIDGYGKENAYIGKGASWFSTPKTGDTYTMQFDKPTLVKRIAIDVGIDSITRDPIVDAVLELSHEKDDKNKCIKYEIVRYFDGGPSVEISQEKIEDRPFILKQIQCIRIRVTKTHEQWAALRMIIVEPK